MGKKVTDFKISFRKDMIFKLIDCYPESDLYEEIEEEFEGLKQAAYDKIKPQAVMEIAPVPDSLTNEKITVGSYGLFVITTVGGEISDWLTKLFAEGDYMAGMLVDAMADDFLFQAAESLHPDIVDFCKERQFGISRRFEAPTGIPMEAQKIAWEVTHAEKELGLGIKSSFMLDPVKSSCQVFLLKEHSEEFRMEHNCRECGRVDCKMRNIPPVILTVKDADNKKIPCGANQSVMDALLEAGIYMQAVCGGRGSCGKCKIKVIEGNIVPAKEDKKFFSTQEIQDGWRLGCKAYAGEDCTIALQADQEDSFQVLTGYQGKKENREAAGGEYIIGVDIGTTTIAMQLADAVSGAVADTYSTINRQRAYGADVISRIQASNDGKKEKLQRSILEDLKEGLQSLLDNNSVSINQMVIAANTTMVHLLMGYSCDTLGVFPFTPFHITTIQTSYSALFGDHSYEFPIIIFPGISAFVGGDIVAGLFSCGFYKKEKISILIDLGTNGEMAIGNSQRILSTSTAAGPAFEGGNILHGTGSIPGAICNVEITNENAQVTTIAEKTAVGLCGTGVLETVRELMKEKLIDETGLLAEEYFENGFPLAKKLTGEEIVFTQKDIREIQMAKAAVRAGVETLLLRYGVGYEEIEQVYLAGGFGYHIDVRKACEIGLLPKELEHKVQAVGNSSLSGAIKYMYEANAQCTIEKIVDSSVEINLSNDKDFNELYMDHMYFEQLT